MEERDDVLYICHETGALGGAALSLMNLIHAMRATVRPVVVVRRGPGDAVNDFFRRQGCACVVAPFELNTTVPFGFRTLVKFIPKYLRYHFVNGLALWRVRAAVSGRAVRLVHTNSSVITFGYHLARRLGVPHVWHLREFQDRDFAVRPFCGWRELKRKIYRADAAIAITEAVYRHWQLDRARRALCLWDAVRPAADACNCPDKGKYVVFCAATLSAAKGADCAVEAFAQSGLAARGYTLRMIGHCPPAYKESLTRLAAGCGVGEAVEFVGFCADVRPHLLRATAFLMCSRDEGLGRVTVEALFYGCPVVARRSGGTPEFIRHGRNGFLFDSVRECAALLRAMPGRDFARLAEEANRTAATSFSEEAYALRLREVYDGVIAPPARGGGGGPSARATRG